MNTTPLQNGLETQNLKGLSTLQIEQKTKMGKVNNYNQPRGRTYWQIVQENAFTFINILLAVVALLLIFVGKVSDGVIYFAVVLLNIVVGLTQEIQAKRKLDKIADLVSPKTTVIRNGEESLINSAQIVEGDIIKIKSGDLINVDGIIEQGAIQVDESILTGESDLLSKKAGEEVFAGTSITTGSGYFVATRVGSESGANKIGSKVKSYNRYLTPVQKEVNLTIRLLFLIAASLGAMVSMAAYLLRTPLEESIQVAAVILGVIPNGLFAMINLAYAVGGVAILRQGALVQKLNAVESLSNVDVLCLDKTGTLTTKNLVLENVINLQESKQDDLEGKLLDFVNLVTDHNATSQAIKEKFNLENSTLAEPIEEIPFSSAYKWSAIRTNNQSLILGASEIIIRSVKLSQSEQEDIQNQINHFQDQGLRVLLFATSEDNSKLLEDNKPVLPNDLKILAILVFSDQIREQARATLQNFKKADVDIKIISGDNPETVRALASQIDIGEDTKIISGLELDKLSESEWSEVVENTQIFGRITPEQKEKIIHTLIANGHYVAMIGDGVNDAMSLKKANLGIAMESGSQVTRSVADILLLNDSFASLPQGLIEGQKIRNALEDIFKIYLTRIFYLVLLIIAVRVVGLPFPFTVKQASLIAVLTTGIPAIGLTLWSHPGIKKQSSLFNSVIHFVLPASITLSIFAVFLLFGLTTVELFHLKDINQLSTLMSLDSPIITIAFNNAIPQLQTTLSFFLILAGLCLNIFVAPPIRLLSAGIETKFAKSKVDIRPSILSFLSVIIFFFLYIVEPIRHFWDLSTLSYNQLLVVLICLVGWVITVQVFWRFKILDRFLGIEIKR